jgi:hypothetical protein
VQVREYPDHWTFQLDRYNPEMGVPEFIGHALTDAIGITLTVACSLLLFVAAVRR